MQTTTLMVRFLLAAVFGLAAVIKLIHRPETLRMLNAFGIPANLARTAAILLPLAELGIAAALLPAFAARWGALGALALLLLSIAAIVASLQRGRRPSCSCFGRLSSAPIGWSTLVRNAIFAAGAVLVLFEQPAQFSSLMRAPPAVPITAAALLLVLIEGCILAQVVAQNGRLLVRLDALEKRYPTAPSAPKKPIGLPVGSPAPAFALRDTDGATRTLDDMLAPGQPVLLVFTDPDCGPCKALLPDLDRYRRDMAPAFGLTIISLQHDREVAQTFRAPRTPSAVLVLADGTIGTPMVEGAEAIRALAGILPKLLRQEPVTA